MIKEILRFLLYLLKRKPYKSKTYNGAEIATLPNPSGFEYFYGYYDRCPERAGKVLMHEMQGKSVVIKVYDIESKQEKVIGESKAYNWQMGARALWIDDDRIAFNDFDGEKYVGRLYSLSTDTIIKTYDKPIQDYSDKGYFLGVNYQRLRSYAKEYGYYCLPELSDSLFDDYEHDGIWWIDAETGEYKLLLPVEEVINFEKNERFVSGKHFVNHIMISPKGESFIFIHRYYVGKERYDRLMFYNLADHQLRCLLSDKMQSHYCWLDNEKIFGYGEYQGRNEFHTINVLTGEVEPCETLTNIHPKDGHPTVHGDWAVIDSYPNLSRMQELIAFNFKTKQIVKFLELYHDLRHIGFNRCDLHPRFSDDGKRVYFDTIYTGLRQLCYIDLSKILN